MPVLFRLLFLVLLLVGFFGRFAHGSDRLVSIPGHVHPLTATAPVASVERADPLTVTVVLRRDDEKSFGRRLRELDDPASPSFRRFLGQAEIADRFGPSPERHRNVRRHLEEAGLTVVEEPANRLTLTVRGERAAVERAFAVDILDYRVGDRHVYANANEPSLPVSLAASVLSVAGLTNLPQLGHAKQWQEEQLKKCIEENTPPFGAEGARIRCLGGDPNKPANGPGRSATGVPPANWLDVAGAGQTVGIVAFDAFAPSDVADFLALAGLPASLASQVSSIHLNGGAVPGPEQAEVLLDVLSVLTVAPGASVVVYDSPFIGFGQSFQSVFNRMVNDGVDVISNSWVYCEDHTTLADVQGIDAIFQQAAMSNIAILNATGDFGDRCLGTSPPGTVTVPAGSPHATAVGGASVQVGPAFTYAGGSWWDDSAHTPPGGQGGFGVSRFFTRPAYQDGFHASPMRSVPDVVASADPANGIMLCQANEGGCPTGRRYGGTSRAAPLWAGYTALLNQAQGENLGPLNPVLYALAGSTAFHDATSLGADFGHVGLGAPNLNMLHVALAGKSIGAVDAAASEIAVNAGHAAADGVSPVFVVVRLRDANGHSVSGKTVTLAAHPGSSAVVTPPSGVSTVANGAVVFEVTNLDAEDVMLTATDTTDGVTIASAPTITFDVPPAANASITASPSPVNADGMSPTTITVTLTDALNRPTPGKTIRLSQGSGHSVIQGPTPPVTGADGRITFTATNIVNETVTYTAVDVTDGDLPVPGSAQVVFQNGVADSCVATLTPPTGTNGYQVFAFATGFVAQNFVFGGVHWVGCPGATIPAFLGDRVFIGDFPTGDLFALDAAGGAATAGNVLANHGPTLNTPTVGKDGKLYAILAVTNGSASNGQIVELDPTTGAIVRTVAQNLLCANGLAVDPLSGDLFFANSCSGFASNPSIFRLNPTTPNSTPTVYATTTGTPNGQIVFTPNGTLYMTSQVFDAHPLVVRVDSTMSPQPPTVTTVSGVSSDFSLAIGAVGANGDAVKFLVNDENKLELVDVTTAPPTRTTLADGSLAANIIGPDGCAYGSLADTVFKVTDSSGGCGFVPKSGSPALTLDPPGIEPDPAQGSTLTFTATFRNVAAPADTPVFLEVTGPNPELRMARTDATGAAVFTHTGFATGRDVVSARATVAGQELVSNRVVVDWTVGRHVTTLNVNLTPSAGPSGEPFAAVAALLDRSTEPPSPIAGATIVMSLGGEECSALTDPSGIASCVLTPLGLGLTPFVATFEGTAQYRGVTVTNGFNAIAPAPLGPFVLYSTSSTKGEAKFFKFGPITLADTAGAIGIFDVVKPHALGAPASVVGGAAPGLTWLGAYAVKPATGAPKLPRRAHIDVATQCGALVLSAGKPASLLVPAAASATDPVTPPSETTVNHFLCHAAKARKKRSDGSAAPGLPKRAQVEVGDGIQTRRYDLKRVAWLCDPVAKSGIPTLLAGPHKGTPFPIAPAAVQQPASRLVCYAAKPAKKMIPQLGCAPANAADKGTPLAQPKHVPQIGIHVASQIETRRLDTKKELFVCLPAATVP